MILVFFAMQLASKLSCLHFSSKFYPYIARVASCWEFSASSNVETESGAIPLHPEKSIQTGGAPVASGNRAVCLRSRKARPFRAGCAGEDFPR